MRVGPLLLAVVVVVGAATPTNAEEALRITGSVVLDTDAQSWNTAAWDQSKIVRLGRFLFVLFWDADGVLVLARTDPTTGESETLRFPVTVGNSVDPHRSTALGVSPGDQRLHLAYDHHADRLKYRHSVGDLVSADTLDLSLFSGEEPLIGSWIEERVTYPRFFNDGRGRLCLLFRYDVSGDGDSHLFRWEEAVGRWGLLGRLAAREGKYWEGGGATRNAYFHDVVVDPLGRAHLTWTWRERGTSWDGNHDLSYAWSDDLIEWRNDAGVVVASLDRDDPLRVDDPGLVVVRIPQGSWLMNQGAMAVDAEGNPHVLTYLSTVRTFDAKQRNLHLVHMWRDPGGKWQLGWVDDPTIPRVAGFSRPAVYIDGDGDLRCHVVRDGFLYGFHSSPSTGWRDWTIRALSDRPLSGDGVRPETSELQDQGPVFIPIQTRVVRAGEVTTGFELLEAGLSAALPPRAPSLAVPQLTTSGALLRWAPSVGAEGYQIYRDRTGSPQPRLVTSPGALATEWTDPTPLAGQSIENAKAVADRRVRYAIRAIGSAGKSPLASTPWIDLPLHVPSRFFVKEDGSIQTYRPTANAGNESRLGVARTANGYLESTFLLFDRGSPVPTGGARLRVHVQLDRDGLPRRILVFGLEDDDWEEQSLTAATAPSGRGRLLDGCTLSAVSNPWIDQACDLDVTDFVNDQDRMVGFRLDLDPTSPPGDVGFWSGEAIDRLRPTLFLDADIDSDGDGIPDIDDPCWGIPGSFDDLDRDGLGDACDPDPEGDLRPEKGAEGTDGSLAAP